MKTEIKYIFTVHWLLIRKMSNITPSIQAVTLLVQGCTSWSFKEPQELAFSLIYFHLSHLLPFLPYMSWLLHCIYHSVRFQLDLYHNLLPCAGNILTARHFQGPGKLKFPRLKSDLLCTTAPYTPLLTLINHPSPNVSIMSRWKSTPFDHIRLNHSLTTIRNCHASELLTNR